MEWSKDLIAAAAAPLVLSILAREESYGYAIIQRVRELTNGEMEWTDGMLYPILHRLEKQKLISSEWRTAENGRRRKYYQIADEGKNHLANARDQWCKVTKALNTLWEPLPCLT